MRVGYSWFLNSYNIFLTFVGLVLGCHGSVSNGLTGNRLTSPGRGFQSFHPPQMLHQRHFVHPFRAEGDYPVR